MPFGASLPLRRKPTLARKQAAGSVHAVPRARIASYNPPPMAALKDHEARIASQRRRLEQIKESL